MEADSVYDNEEQRLHRVESMLAQVQAERERGGAYGGRERTRQDDFDNGGAYQPDVRDTAGGTARSTKRARHPAKDEPGSVEVSGRNPRTSDNGRAGRGVPLTDGGDAAGGRVGSKSLGRQVAGAKDAVADVQARIEGTIKNVLLSLGFDFSGDTRPLTLEEVKLHEAGVADFVQKLGIGIDYCLWHMNKDRAESDVWMLPDEMALAYARFILRRAKAVGWLGETVRQIETIQGRGDDARVALDFAKRLVTTPLFIQSNGGLGVWIR